MFWKDIEKICKNSRGLTKNAYKRLEEELGSKRTLIEENPYLYQSLELNKQIRRFFIQKYVIFYRIKGKNITIIRILPQKANYHQKGIYRIKSTKQLEFNKRK